MLVVMRIQLVLVAVALLGCKKEKEGAPAPTPSATAPEAAPAAAPTPVEDVDCDTAGKEYAKKMAATPGNVLSDAKPDSGLVYYAGVSMADYCIGEGGLVPWTAEQRACVKAAAMDAAAVTACFTGDALSQVNAGLNEVVTTALANQKANAAAADAAP
jgi:hypothetical protein